jgi:hypothetical protein
MAIRAWCPPPWRDPVLARRVSVHAVNRMIGMTAMPSSFEFGVDFDTEVDIDAIFDLLTVPGTERHLESDEYDILVLEAGPLDEAARRGVRVTRVRRSEEPSACHSSTRARPEV